MNGYNFTERVRKVLALSREEAGKLGHEYIGTEHLLLGLISEGEGVGCTILQNLSVELDDLQYSIMQIVKRGQAPRTGPDLPYTSRSKKVLELAMVAASEVNHSFVGTEHLLLGLLREDKGVAAQVLYDAGVNADNARAEMIRILGVPEASPPRDVPVPRHSARVAIIVTTAHQVAARRQAILVTHADVAIALLEHGEGMANAALDRLGLDRAAAVAALNALSPVPDSTIGPDDVRQSAGLTKELDWLKQFPGPSTNSGLRTHDLLLAIIATSPDVARVFAAHKIDRQRLLEEIERISG